MSEDSHAITSLLLEWRSGSKEAADRLVGLVYGELHRMAAREMRRERCEQTLQTTALVHEAYVRLCGSDPIQWQDRVHFFAVGARQLRRVSIDHARRIRSKKRGGGRIEATLFEADGGAWQFDERVLAVDQALVRLEALDSRAREGGRATVLRRPDRS